MNLWQWSQYKSLRPKMAAIFGDCLTELIEDIPRGNILPNTLDPRDVLDIQIDDAGNVKAYTVQRRVYVPASNAYGKPRQSENYLYRKEVDGDAIRYFKDDKPYDYTGNGPVIPNPYTFVAAVWDRHEIVSYSDYGIAATEKTLPQTKILNSIMSHAMDYQQKQFAAPVGIKGATVGRPGATVSLGGPDTSPDTAWDVEEARRKLAEKMTLIQMGPEGEFVTVTSDLGQTREMLAALLDLAGVHFAQGNLGDALQLLAVVIGHPAGEQTSLNHPEPLRDEAEKVRAQIESRLGEATYRSAWEAGRRQSLAQVVAQILD